MARIPSRLGLPAPSGRLARCPSLLADWIEQLFAEGITAG